MQLPMTDSRSCLTMADLACWHYPGKPDKTFAAKLEGRD